jgi:hypothetical protein
MPGKTTDKLAKKVTKARPTVERVAKDKQLRKHVKNAYGSARSIYDDLFYEGAAPTEATARQVVARLAQDPELQDELRNVFAELRAAGKRAKKAAMPTHKGRNAVLMAGIVIGILYNPKTGADTRRWLKEKVFGPEETFEFET